MNRLSWSCTLRFKQFVALLVIPRRSKNVRSIAKETLIKNKRAAGRTQDLADVERLEKISKKRKRD